MKPIIINKNFKKIDDSYFENYGGKPYSESYQNYTKPAELIFNELTDQDINFDTILDLGCASGELVRDLRLLGLKAYGIEKNKTSLAQSIVPQFCIEMDINNIDQIKPNSFDIVYTNSLMYFQPNEILPILQKINKITKQAIFLCIPYLNETYFNDPYRVFLASRIWWEKQLDEAGFAKVTSDIYTKI